MLLFAHPLILELLTTSSLYCITPTEGGTMGTERITGVDKFIIFNCLTAPTKFKTPFPTLEATPVI